MDIPEEVKEAINRLIPDEHEADGDPATGFCFDVHVWKVPYGGFDDNLVKVMYDEKNQVAFLQWMYPNAPEDLCLILNYMKEVANEKGSRKD